MTANHYHRHPERRLPENPHNIQMKPYPKPSTILPSSGGIMRRPKLLAAVMLLALSPAILAEEAPEIDIYFLGGQSNMVGLGLKNELPVNLPAAENIRIFHSASLSSGLPANTWHPLVGSSNNAAMFGPEIGFAHVMAGSLPGKPIGLIKHARGGARLSTTPLSYTTTSWSPDLNEEFTVFMDTANQALQALVADGWSPRIAGMLWVQGESDANSVTTGQQYLQNLTNFIARIRSEFEAPDMPFVYARILPYGGPRVALADVLEAMEKIDQDSGDAAAVNRAFMVRTSGLGIMEDNVHYNTPGQLGLGVMMAQSLLKRTQGIDLPERLYAYWSLDGKPVAAPALSYDFEGTDDAARLSQKAGSGTPSLTTFKQPTSYANNVGFVPAFGGMGLAARTYGGTLSSGSRPTGAAMRTSQTINLSPQGTIIYRVKPISINDQGFAISGLGVGSTRWYFFHNSTSGGDAARMTIGGEPSAVDLIGGSTGVSYTANNWYHVAQTWSMADGQIALNAWVANLTAGDAALTKTVTNVQRAYTTMGTEFLLHLGCLTGPGNFFNGEIDAVTIYDSALSAVEIQNLFTQSGSSPGVPYLLDSAGVHHLDLFNFSPVPPLGADGTIPFGERLLDGGLPRVNHSAFSQGYAVRRAHDPAFEMGDSAWTLRGYFKNNALGNQSGVQVIAGTASTLSGQKGWRLFMEDGLIHLTAAPVNGATAAIATTGRYDDQQAHSFAVVWNPDGGNGEMTLHIDGQVAATGPGAGNLAADADDLRRFAIGADITGTAALPAPGGQMWSGALDEFAFLHGIEPVASALRLRSYAVGGAAGPELPGEPLELIHDSNHFSVTAIVRAGDPRLAVIGEAVGNPGDYGTPELIIPVEGSASGVDQDAVPVGCERRIFRIGHQNEPRWFMRLRAALDP